MVNLLEKESHAPPNPSRYLLFSLAVLRRRGFLLLAVFLLGSSITLYHQSRVLHAVVSKVQQDHAADVFNTTLGVSIEFVSVVTSY